MEIKALAPARALEFAQEVGISQSILEGDSKVIMKALVEEGRSLAQGSQYRTGGCIDLASGMIYFGTSQYWYTVSGLPLFYIFNIHTHTQNLYLP